MAGEFIEVQIKGFKELEAYLNEFTEKVAKSAVASGVLTGSLIVANEAKVKAPIATKPHRAYSGKYTILPGALRASIRPARIKSSQASVMYSVGPRKTKGIDTFYWRFLEFGTRFIAPRPFLRPAFDGNIARIIEAVRSRLAARVEKENARLARLVSG